MIRQTYSLPEMQDIFHVTHSTVARREGGRLPRRWSGLGGGQALWAKAAIWDHLGLAPPDGGLDLPVLLSTRDLATLLGVGMGTISDAARMGRVPVAQRAGTNYFFSANWLATSLGAPLVAWPEREADPAFTAVAMVQAPLPVPVPVPVRLDGEALGRLMERACSLALTELLPEIERRVAAVVHNVLRQHEELTAAGGPPPSTSLRDRVRGLTTNADREQRGDHGGQWRRQEREGEGDETDGTGGYGRGGPGVGGA